MSRLAAAIVAEVLADLRGRSGILDLVEPDVMTEIEEDLTLAVENVLEDSLTRVAESLDAAEADCRCGNVAPTEAYTIVRSALKQGDR